MKKRVAEIVEQGLISACDAGELSPTARDARGTLDIPKDRGHGDLSTNVAMLLARSEGKPPRAIAEILIRHLSDPDHLLTGTEVAGPGFLNFSLAPRYWQETLAELLADPALGIDHIGAGKRVQVEFVSANPTGPLTVGHGRNAVLGDTIARLLSATGHEVEREYYFNNAGRQMKVLGASVRARYLEEIGRPAELPEDGYQGDYIREIARALVSRSGDSLADDPGPAFQEAGEQAIFAEIRRTQERLGVRFDNYFNEDGLYRSGAIERVVDELSARGLVDRREGAVWLLGEPLGLPKDRVLIKSSGEPAYRLPDIAYHCDKLARRFDELIDVLGADHIDEHREVVAAIRALGLDAARIRPVIYQFVTLTRHGEQVKMSTRRAEYVTVDELLDEVGVDAVRFFFLTRKSDSHLEFDLELAKKASLDNPVYYVQYAHARIANLFGQARLRGVPLPTGTPEVDALAALDSAEEFELIRQLASYGEIVSLASRELEPHRLVFYLQELAAALHRFYNRHHVLGDERPDRVGARLVLMQAVQRVVAAGLGILGVAAPERM